MDQRPPGWGDLKKSMARFMRKNGLRPAPGQAAQAPPPQPAGAPGAAAAAPDRPAARAPARAPTPAPAAEEKAYAVPFDRDAWPKRAVLRLTSPKIGNPAVNAIFGEHPLDASGEASERVVLLHEQSAFESKDLGQSWTQHPIHLEAAAERVFTTSTGHHLVQTQPSAQPGDVETRTVTRRYDADWKPAGEPLVTRSPWHGTCSVGEQAGTILFAEYPVNRGKYGPADNLPLADQLVSDPCVWRSRDDGRTWEVVFQVPSTQIRHLHTVAPEPGRPGRWWLTSGDRAEESHVWVSDDDGDSWRDITSETCATPLHPTCRPRSVQRQTDQVFHDGWVIWGADDWLGEIREWAQPGPAPMGSRIFKARADGPWEPQEIGFCGPPIRSIVDVGPAFLFLTEAKAKSISLRPESFLVFKDELDRVHRFVQFDNWGEATTGFTYSRASRKARDGVFFSYRGARDVFNRSPRFLRWQIEFF